MLSPTPPAMIWAIRTAPGAAAENASTISWRAVGDVEPLSGPKTSPPTA